MINLETERLVRLSNIQTVLHNWGIASMIIDGALLGLVRNGKLITWDWDAEIAIISSQFNMENFEYAMTDLVRQNYKIKSVSGLKFFKISLYHLSDPNFIYSVFLLREASDYYVRPRFRYPKHILDGGHDVISIHDCFVWIPKRAIELLEFVYGKSWQIPLKSRKATEYLSRSVFRWGYLDFCYRLINKIPRFKILFPRFLVSKYLNKREFIFRSIIKCSSMPPFNLMEIGSSDATESKTFFTSHKTGHSVIFEPRETARNVILNNKIIRKHFNRLILRSEIVVARSGESRSFRRNVRGHLSHIDNSDDSVSNESEFHEIQIDQLKDEVVTSTYLIKMDLEGYELSLLKQLNRTIDVNAPIAILIELHQDKYDVLNAKSVLEELFYNGFKIELIETASHPRPISLISYLSNTPFIISGRRALWSIKENCENDIVQYLTSKSFVYNNFTAEAGYRNIRSVLISRHMNFVKPRKNLSTNIWQLIYKI